MDEIRACSRTNPHTAHGTCLGTAPEFPWEQIEQVSADAGLFDAVACAECGGVSKDLDLIECPADGGILGEIPMTEAEFGRRKPFGSL